MIVRTMVKKGGSRSASSKRPSSLSYTRSGKGEGASSLRETPVPWKDGRTSKHGNADDAGETDWERLGRETDDDILAAIAADPDAAPPLDAAWFARARVVFPPKQTITIKLDGDVLEWFRAGGKGYQTRINSVLRTFMDHHRRRKLRL